MTATSDFWARFVAKLDELAAGGDTADAAVTVVLEALAKIDPRLSCFIGNHEDGHDAIFTLEGHYDLGPVIDELLAAAPALPGWRVIALLDSSLLFGDRNMVLFPDDDNGGVLMQMAANGDQMWRSRDIDFLITFPSEAQAMLLGEGLMTGATVTVTRPLIPTHPNLTVAEASLAAWVEPLAGKVTHWSCLQVSALPKK